MIGDGKAKKSMAYVENVAAFIEYSLNFKPGIHVYNYVDKPDFDMNSLVKEVYKILGKSNKYNFRIPYWLGYAGGKFFDLVSFISGKKFPISALRIKKFSMNTCFNTKVSETGFVPPIDIKEGLRRTLLYEFKRK